MLLPRWRCHDGERWVTRRRRERGSYAREFIAPITTILEKGAPDKSAGDISYV